MGRPRELGPLVAEVFARRGLMDRSNAIVQDLFERAETAEQVLALAPAASRTGEARLKEMLLRAALLPSQPNTALRLAAQLDQLDRREDALMLLRKSVEGLSGEEAKRVGRALRLLEVAQQDIPAQLGRELASDPSAECAAYVLGRSEIWRSDGDRSSQNAEIVAKALDILRTSLGEESLRVVIA